MSETKICIKCGRELPLTEKYFPKDKNCKSGFRNVCRECQSGHSSGFLRDDYKRPPKWEENDVKLLKAKFRYYTDRELRDMFFPYRSVQAVISKAQSLNLGSKTLETYRRMHEEKLRGEFIDEICSFSQEMKDQMSKTKREYFKTHDGARKGTEVSDIQRQLMKDRSKGRWIGNTNPRHIKPLYGSENGRWKGGVNPVYLELRSEIKQWQQESMIFCNYHCVISNERFDNVHHLVPFRDIVDEVFRDTGIEIKDCVGDYHESDFEILKDELNKLHFKYGFGACLQKEIHMLFHNEYGYTKCTPYDFLDFVYRIDCGDYDKWFADNGIKVCINYNFIEYLESTFQKINCA